MPLFETFRRRYVLLITRACLLSASNRPANIRVTPQELRMLRVGLLVPPSFANLSFAPLAVFDAANLMLGEVYYEQHVVSASYQPGVVAVRRQSSQRSQLVSSRTNLA
jgi:hypothetical protein